MSITSGRQMAVNLVGSDGMTATLPVTLSELK